MVVLMQNKAKTAFLPSIDRIQSQIFYQFSLVSSDGASKESKKFIITTSPYSYWLNFMNLLLFQAWLLNVRMYYMSKTAVCVPPEP